MLGEISAHSDHRFVLCRLGGGRCVALDLFGGDGQQPGGDIRGLTDRGSQRGGGEGHSHAENLRADRGSPTSGVAVIFGSGQPSRLSVADTTNARITGRS